MTKVDLTIKGAVETLTIGPEDTLVVTVPQFLTSQSIADVRDALIEELRTDRIIVVTDAVSMKVVRSEDM